MQILSKRAAPLTPWKWTPIDQRAFEDVKEQINEWQNLR